MYIIYINICVCICIHACIQCEAMSSPVAEGGYQPFSEPSGLTVKSLSLSPEARDLLLHQWLLSGWDASSINCVGVSQSLAGELQGEALTKRAKLKSQLAGRKAPHCFVYFCGRARMLRPRKSRQNVSRLRLWKGWLQQSHRQFQQVLGLPCPTWDVPQGWEMPSSHGYPVSPGNLASRTALAASNSHIFQITVQAPALFHP